MGKVEVNKKKKKNALYKTAFELFTTQGIAKTTISDIVNKAGVAKGTFYLYFKDKYDIRSKLVMHKAQELFYDAHIAMLKAQVTGFEPQIHFLVDYILDRMEGSPSLVDFFHKNLSMGIFINLLENDANDSGYHFGKSYREFFSQSGSSFYEQPELLLFAIIELVSGTAYSCIIQKQPVGMAEFRPFLHKSIDGILQAFLHEPAEHHEKMGEVS